jgi:hypothetical protein
MSGEKCLPIKFDDFTINIKKFDTRLLTCRENRIIIVLGVNTSNITKDLLYNIKETPVGVCITNSNDYDKHIPYKFIYNEYSSQILNNILERQRIVVKNVMDNLKVMKINDSELFILIDNKCISNLSSFWTDKNMRELFLNCHHYHIRYILSSDYPILLTPMLRTNIDLVFIKGTNNINYKKDIYYRYANIFPSFETFCNTLEECFTNNGYLVIHNSSSSIKLEDMIFYYNEIDHGDFKVGCDDYWNF